MVEKAEGVEGAGARSRQGLPAGLPGWGSAWAPFLVGALLRVAGLDRLSIWLDEATSIMLSREPIAIILRDTQDTHPPLYHLMLHLWMGAGDAAWWVRGLSALLGSLTIPAIYALGRALFGKNAGLIAAWVLALSPWHVWYSQEARMYAAACLMATLSLLGGALWLQRRNPLYALLFLAATLAGLYLDYTFLLLWPAEAIVLLWLCRRRLQRGAVATWLLLQVVVGAGLVPLRPFFEAHFQTFLTPGFLRARIGFMTDYLLPAAVVGVAAGLLALGAWAWLRGLRPKTMSRLELAGLLLLLPLSIALILFPGASTLKRVLLVLLPLAVIGIAWAADRAPWPAINPRGIALLSVLGLGLMLLTLQKEEWRTAVAEVGPLVRQGDIVLMEARWMSRPWDYYSRGAVQTVGVDPSLLDGELENQLQGRERVWLIMSQEHYVDPGRTVAEWLARRFTLRETRAYHQIDIQLYEVAK